MKRRRLLSHGCGLLASAGSTPRSRPRERDWLGRATHGLLHPQKPGRSGGRPGYLGGQDKDIRAGGEINMVPLSAWHGDPTTRMLIPNPVPSPSAALLTPPRSPPACSHGCPRPWPFQHLHTGPRRGQPPGPEGPCPVATAVNPPDCRHVEAPVPPTAKLPSWELQACCSTAPTRGKPTSLTAGCPRDTRGQRWAGVTERPRQGLEQRRRRRSAPRLRTTSPDAASRNLGNEHSGPRHGWRMRADNPVADSQPVSSTSRCPTRRAQRSQEQGACGHSDGGVPSS